MKKNQKKIISAVLTSVILAGNTQLAFSVPPRPTENNEMPYSSEPYYYYPTEGSEGVVLNKLPYVNSGWDFTGEQLYYVPQQLADTYIDQATFIPQQKPNSVPQVQTECKDEDFYYNQGQLEIKLLREELLAHFSKNSSPDAKDKKSQLKFDLEKLVFPPPQTYIRPAFSVPKQPKDSKEYFKPAKAAPKLRLKTNLSSTNPKSLSPNPLSLNIIPTYEKAKENNDFDHAFKCLSEYIFNSSFIELKEATNAEIFKKTKNLFINSRNPNLLTCVGIACLQVIKNSTRINDNEKNCLINFLSLTMSLENSVENACIIVLVYTQILQISHYIFNSEILKSIKIVSENLSKKLKNMYHINPKKSNSDENVKRLKESNIFYLLAYRAIIRNINKNPQDIHSIYKEVKTDPFLNR